MWAIVGFEVLPCSIKRLKGEPLEDITCAELPLDLARNPEPQVVAPGEAIVYTYNVYWTGSDIEWSGRWDAYLRVSTGGAEINLSTVCSALMLAALLSVSAVAALLRTMRRDLANHKIHHGPIGDRKRPEAFGWMRVAGDVFCEPPAAAQLAELFGGGVHVLLTVASALGLAATGSPLPTTWDALAATATLVRLAITKFVTAYCTVWLWCNLQRSSVGWRRVCLIAAFAIPGAIFLSFVVLNTMLSAIDSGRTPRPFSLQYSRPGLPVVLRLLISCGVAYPGGYMAAHAPLLSWPKHTNMAPHTVSPSRWFENPYVMFSYAGLLPLSTLYIALDFGMGAAWRSHHVPHRVLLLSCGLTVLNTAQMSILCTYMQLCAQDYNWWWRSFHRGGATAVFVLLFAMYYLLVYLPEIASHSASVLLYACYMSGVALVAYIGLGAVGFATSLAFVWLASSRFDGVAADGREHVDGH